MLPMSLRPSLPWIRLLFGLLALVAIGWQLAIQIRYGFSALNFFSFFTNLSNLFAAVVLLAGAAQLLLPKRWSFPSAQVRFISVVNMTVVGVVFSVLLQDVDLGSLQPWINFVLHYAMPLAVALDWLLQPPHQRLGARHLVLTLVFPALYLSYVLFRGAVAGWYPYPFLNPANVGGYGGVALYSLAIASTFLLSGWALLTAGNYFGARRRGV